MKPWDIIGWFVIAVFVLLVAAILLVATAGWARKTYLHIKTKDTPLKVGQIWLQDSDELKIKALYENNFVIQSGCASWGETYDSWPQRVKNRKLILIKDAK